MKLLHRGRRPGRVKQFEETRKHQGSNRTAPPSGNRGVHRKRKGARSRRPPEAEGRRKQRGVEFRWRAGGFVFGQRLFPRSGLRTEGSKCSVEGVLKPKRYRVCFKSVLSRTGFPPAVSMAASLRAVWSSCPWMHLVATSKQLPPRIGAVCHACHKSTYSVLPEDYNCKVELALTSDSKTIVCYHPSLEIPYEHTKPMPRPDPVNNKEETLNQVLKSRLNEEELKNDRGLIIEELSKMFYTTKHRWYPVGQKLQGEEIETCLTELKEKLCVFRYHRRRKNPNPPKDR